MCGRFTYAKEFREIRIRFEEMPVVFNNSVNSPRNDLPECIEEDG